jgi:hypothetical protein
MRISRRFHLNRSQAELDFVDIDTNRDLRVFVDPYFLASRQDPWSTSASHTIRNFFSYFIGLISQEEEDEARNLFDNLHEPNETCLGMSRRRPDGNGIGDGDANRIFESILESEAARTGLLEHLEDCRVFVRGIDKDKTSDMTTNIIRRHLIEYTQSQCDLWDIPMTDGSPGGFFWMLSREAGRTTLLVTFMWGRKESYSFQRRLSLIRKDILLENTINTLS